MVRVSLRMHVFMLYAAAWSQFWSLSLSNVLHPKRWPEVSSPPCLKGTYGDLCGCGYQRGGSVGVVIKGVGLYVSGLYPSSPCHVTTI